MMVRTIKAYPGDSVEIQWCLNDGTVYIERHTVAPKSVLEARTERSGSGFTATLVPKKKEQ